MPERNCFAIEYASKIVLQHGKCHRDTVIEQQQQQKKRKRIQSNSISSSTE